MYICMYVLSATGTDIHCIYSIDRCYLRTGREMDASMTEDMPVRSFMNGDHIEWRQGRPDYNLVNELYMRERSKVHETGSLERTVENIVKTWEMELRHKVNTKEWQTIVQGKFRWQINGGKFFDADESARIGSYKVMLADAPLYNATGETLASSTDDFITAFPGGFAWEVTDVISGPPVVSFTWRHWAYWTGPYKGREPTGERVEMVGCTVATVDDDLKLEEVKLFFDPNPLLAKLLRLENGTVENAAEGVSTGICPFHCALK